MLRCPKCGTDNLLNAVFCRGCGDRLNLDEIKPDNFADLGEKKSADIGKNLIAIVIVAVLLAAFFTWRFNLLDKLKGSSDDAAGDTSWNTHRTVLVSEQA